MRDVVQSGGSADNRTRTEKELESSLFVKLYEKMPERGQDAIHKAFKWTGISAYAQLLFDSPLRDRRWFETFDGAPTDAAGDPLPWMPYCFIDFLSDRIKPSFSVFEYGSGFSTRWYAERVDRVVAIEDDPEWCQRVDAILPANAEVTHSTDIEYPSAIDEYGQFEIIVIDGKRRSECAAAAVNHLTSDGIIIWDDTNNRYHNDGYEILRAQGFRELFFQGMGPVTANLQRTSVFYRDSNCLNI